MKWLITKNNKPVKLRDIPLTDMRPFRGAVIRQVLGGTRPVLFFG